jgi:predicted nucleic acid-binding Zn ribbon protein
MGPIENPTGHPENQEGRRKRLPRRPRMRRCLLKGCEEHFAPRQARQRYCSEECRQTAREWSRWKAQERYRATRAGKQQRNGQSRRYRERVKSRKPPKSQRQLPRPRGSSLQNIFFGHGCDRPGCYERFAPQRRSPVQHFCSPECRRALERVREREQRWKQGRDLIRRY